MTHEKIVSQLAAATGIAPVAAAALQGKNKPIKASR